MDIITSVIADALVQATGQTVQDAYAALKTLLLRKFGEKSELSEAVTILEQKPNSKARKVMLAEEVEAIGADKDKELLAVARQLQELLKGAQPQAVYYVNVTQQYGAGAIAQHGSVAAGAGGVAVGGSVFTHSGSGEQNIAQGKNAIGKQVNNYNAPQASTEELVKLLAEIRKQLPNLPEEAREDVQHELKKAQEQAEKNPPDTKKIAERLNNAAEVVEALPRTVAAAGTVIGLVKQVLGLIGF